MGRRHYISGTDGARIGNRTTVAYINKLAKKVSNLEDRVKLLEYLNPIGVGGTTTLLSRLPSSEEKDKLIIALRKVLGFTLAWRPLTPSQFPLFFREEEFWGPQPMHLEPKGKFKEEIEIFSQLDPVLDLWRIDMAKPFPPVYILKWEPLHPIALMITHRDNAPLLNQIP